MAYNPFVVKERYNQIVNLEEESERSNSFRVLIPRFFIGKYINSDDIALDAAGGVGINAILMAQLCREVTLVDLSPEIFDLNKRMNSQ